MTNEEAIKRIQEHMIIHAEKEPRAIYITEALDMAIKVLEQQPSEDCISRQVVKEMLTEEWTKYMPMELDVNLAFVLDKISALPSVTPQLKTGRWIDIMVGDMQAQACDQCKTFYPLAYTGGGHRFCPNCGAKMTESEE